MELNEVWSDRRLGIALMNRLSAFGRRGHVDTRLIAEHFQVSPGTVRRWIREGVPRSRVEALRELVLPPATVLRQEDIDLAYAREALWDIGGRGAPVSDLWVENGWLKPHSLAVVSFGDRQLCTARLGRTDGERTNARMRADGGEVIELVTFRNRFAAQIAKIELLQQVSEWRVSLPHAAVSRGHTEAWLASAPRPTLEELRTHPAVRIPHTKPRKKTSA